MGKASRKPELEAFAEQCVASGRFGPPDRVLRPPATFTPAALREFREARR